MPSSPPLRSGQQQGRPAPERSDPFPDRPHRLADAASRNRQRPNRPGGRARARSITFVAALGITVAAGTSVSALTGPQGGTSASATSSVPVPATTTTQAQPSTVPTTPESPTPEPSSGPVKVSTSIAPGPAITFSIGYAGDVLMHDTVLNDTPNGEGDITSLVEAENPWVQGVDLALCGMEVPVAPDGVYSSYPLFGTAPGVVTALKQVGWDGCSTASNHALDRDLVGLTTTLDAFDDAGLGHAGTFRSKVSTDQGYQLYDMVRQGRTITVAQIASTYGINGYETKPYKGDNVELNSVARIKAQAVAARQAGADVVVVQAHLGTEYLEQPDEDQTTFAQEVADTGQVDLLLDGHPHVPQASELLSGGPNGSGMWVSHCAGNYVSAQSEAYQTLLATVGTFVWTEVAVDEAGTVSVTGLRWHPFTMDAKAGSIVRDLGALHDGQVPEGTTLSSNDISRRWEAVTSVLGSETYSALPPTPTGDAPTVVTDSR